MNRKIAISLVASIVIFVLGIYFGFNRGTKSGYKKGVEDLSTIIVVGTAVELKNDVKLLNYLQNGDIKESKELLESLVDIHVLYLGDGLKHTKYPAPMEKKILNAIRYAKNYREKYPEHKSKFPKVKEEIEAIFQNISSIK
jgi:hypothetical protein